MFKSKKLTIEKKNYSVFCSDILKIPNGGHFFTTRDLIVNENTEMIKNYLKVDRLIKPEQTHGANVEIVTDKKDFYPDCDALILDTSDSQNTTLKTAIYLNFADCTPVILYDTKNRVLSIVHAGWRSTAKRIVVKAIEKMQKNYNTNPSDITCAIGACISFDCFEISKETKELLKKSVSDDNGLFKKAPKNKDFNDKYFANLKGINKRQMIEAGVLEKNIDVSPYCTVLDNDKFFSYRLESKKVPDFTARHSAVAWL